MQETRQLLRRWLWGLGILALVFFAAWRLKTLAILFLLSFLFAYVLNPLVTRLDRLRFINRTGATFITLFGLLIGFLALLLVIIPDVVEEFRQFIGRLPAQLQRLQLVTVPWAESTFDIAIPRSFEDAIAQFGKDLNNLAPKVIGPAKTVITRVLGGTFSAIFAAIGAFMFPLFLFFLLKDFPRVVSAVDGLVPRSSVERFHEIGREVDASLSAFLHGQFTVMLILGTLYSIGYSIVGIPVAIGIGLLTGLLCFIPYVGAATGFVLALLLALLDFHGWGTVLGVVIVFGGVQLLDGTFLTPKILGGKLGLRPLWIIVALMAGAELFGFLGVLLAVPTTAVLKVLVGHTVSRYKRSSLYNLEQLPGRPPPEAPAETGVPPETSSPAAP